MKAKDVKLIKIEFYLYDDVEMMGEDPTEYLDNKYDKTIHKIIELFDEETKTSVFEFQYCLRDVEAPTIKYGLDDHLPMD